MSDDLDDFPVCRAHRVRGCETCEAEAEAEANEGGKTMGIIGESLSAEQTAAVNAWLTTNGYADVDAWMADSDYVREGDVWFYYDAFLGTGRAEVDPYEQALYAMEAAAEAEAEGY